MKKLNLFILILTLFTIFFSGIQAQAQTAPLGTCVLNLGTYTKTEANCKSYADFKSWTPNNTTPTTPAPAPAPTGECWANGNNVTAGVDHVVYEQCIANHWCWRKTGDPIPPEPCGPKTTPATPPPQVPLNQSNTQTQQSDPIYHLLAPLPCDPKTSSLCVKDPISGNYVLSSFDPTSGSDNNKLGDYLNTMITIFIGICSVLAVVMITMGGIEYMGSELISSKEAGKDKIKGALLGLLLALGSYTLLKTINPELLQTDLGNLRNVRVDLSNFTISGSGALSKSGNAMNIDFNTQAYPAALNAQTRTGIDAAFTLAIFAQETSGGANTGACLANDANARMTNTDKAALQTIVGGDISQIHVSCALSQGYGGAIGLTQFLPSTWLEVAKNNNAAALLGHNPDPWNTNDALMMTALYLKQLGGTVNQQQAACSYFGACTSGGVNYANDIMARITFLQAQIAQAKKDGKI